MARQATFKIKQGLDESREAFVQRARNLMVERYGVTEEEARVSFDSCMAYDFAIVRSADKTYPNGVLVETDLYRTTLSFYEQRA